MALKFFDIILLFHLHYFTYIILENMIQLCFVNNLTYKLNRYNDHKLTAYPNIRSFWDFKALFPLYILLSSNRIYQYNLKDPVLKKKAILVLFKNLWKMYQI